MALFPILRLGSSGPAVQNWQRFLNAATSQTLAIDGAFGPQTNRWTRAWQDTNMLRVDGVVGPKSRTVATRNGYIPFLSAKHFTPTTGRAIDLVVIHDMEYPETQNGAEWCAGFFAGSNAPQASAHYAIDTCTIVQCVRDIDVAWHAPGANNNGIGIEHAGYAKQSRDEWLDDYSRAELALSARLVSRLCRTYGIPLRWLDADALKKPAARGITGHRDVSLAFGGTHTDPGPNFPISYYLSLLTDLEDS